MKIYYTVGQKYSRLRCLLLLKGLVICFYLGWSGSILQFRQNIIKVGSKSWLLTCSSNITLSLPSYTGSALKRELNFCNGYLSLLYLCLLPSVRKKGITGNTVVNFGNRRLLVIFIRISTSILLRRSHN